MVLSPRLRLVLATLLAAMSIAAAGALGTGRVAYAVTHGVSMEPNHHTGDLVVVVRSGSYHAGQVVAYRSAVDGRTVVLHRIIGGTGAGYVIKGDNNQSVDPTRPSASQVIGREVLHIPKVGLALRYPLVRILLAGCLVGLDAVLLSGSAWGAGSRPEIRWCPSL